MDFLKPSEQVDLTNCEREPIHLPGSVQPIGHLLVIDHSGKMLAANQKFFSLLKIDPHQYVPTPIASVIPEVLQTSSCQLESSVIRISLREESFDLRRFPIDAETFGIELLPISADPSLEDLTFLNNRLDEITHSASVKEWGEKVTATIQELLEYDRVMLYRFDEEYNGQVIEEIIAAKMKDKLEPYKGLNYPAGDIPPQARQLYMQKLSRVIADVSYTPDPILPASLSVDLSHSNIRSVSPIHLEYLSNMGVKATFVLSILIRGKLWGMIACHHNSALNLPFSRQKIAETAIILSSHVLQSLLDKEIFLKDTEAVEKVRKIFDCSPEKPLLKILGEAGEMVLGLLASNSGVVKVMGQNLLEIGQVPSRDKVLMLLDWIDKKIGDGDVYSSKRLGHDFAPFASEASIASGVMALRLHGSHVSKSDDKSFLLWFRPEVQQTINWGGNPNEKLSINQATGRLSPRGSFSLWQEVTRGHSLVWSEQDVRIARIFKNHMLDFLATQNAMKRRQAEELYMQSQRVVDLGRMAATAAHDFNNILQGMVGAIDISEEALPPEFTQRIETLAERGKGIVRSLLTYARTKQEDYQKIEVFHFFEEISILAKVLLPKTIHFEKDFRASSQDTIIGSKQELFQAIVNLIINAKDAIADKAGKISFSCQNNNHFISFSVRDNGPGISPDHLPKIFDPFFTTKGEQKGTGLGLSYIKQIIESHNGKISVSSLPGEGSQFTLDVPLCGSSKTVTIPTQPNSVSSFSVNKLNVIYIEDEPDLLESFSLIFRKVFGSVQSFSAAEEALAVLATGESQVDLVICDLRMPNMDGIEFYRKLREFNREVVFALMSGELNLDKIIGDLPQKESVVLLPKPCRKDELIEKVTKGFSNRPSL